MKKAITIDEQVLLLKNRGVIVSDENKAKEILLDIGFYRLGFYAFPFEKKFPNIKMRNHIVKEGTKFSDIVSLYYFDTDLRNILMPFLHRIEVSLRTYVTYTASIKYVNDPTWFVNSEYVKDSYITNFLSKVYNTISNNPAIKRHHKNYNTHKYAPAWKTMEFMTFGNIMNLYDNLKDNLLREEIAKHYGCNIKTFINYFNTIRILRNHCAHGNCIYNIRLPKGIAGTGGAGKFYGEDRHNINGAIRVVKYILGKISRNRLNELTTGIEVLMAIDRGDNVNDTIKICGGFKQFCK